MLFWRRKSRGLRIQFGAHSDVGPVRKENQDSYGHFPEDLEAESSEKLFIVADGMGGHVGGLDASRTAVGAVAERFFSSSGETMVDRLTHSFEAGNEAVREMSRESDQEGMGTTCTALAICNGKAYLAHVGDSVAYVASRNHLDRLTNDHTVAGELRREEVITSEEAESHPKRHVLTRSMGIDEGVDVDVFEVGNVKPRQAFLLCSDGLEPVSEDEIIRTIAKTPDAEECCRILVKMAHDRGSLDNATAALIRIL